MNELTQQMEEDQTDVIDKTKNIASLASQVKKLKALEDEIKFDEDLIKKKKKNLEQISGEIIPTLLSEMGLSSLKSFKAFLNLKIKGPGEKIICENSGNKNLNFPYLEALIILILGVPAFVPGISWIT